MTQAQRYDGLDGLRAGAMLLGLAYHATFPWLPDIARWYFVADADPVPALVLVTGLLHAFRMQLFFALSGFFSHLVFERRGPAGFLRDRARRLVVPMLIALPLVVASEYGLRAWSDSLGLLSADYVNGRGVRASPLHLWFLVYLFSFCLLAWALPRWDGFARAVRLGLRAPWLLGLVLSGPTALGLWLHPENRPDAAFWPLPFELVHYGLFFAFGWALWTAREQLSRLRAQAPVLGACGLALGLFVFSGATQWTPLGHVLAGLVAWLMTLGGFGLAFSAPARERPWLRFLVEASYWVYLVHYPVVLALQLAFAQTPGPGLLEYAATVVATFGFALGTFALLVRRSALGPWLGVKPVDAR